MKISELIKELHKYKINYGDWDVYTLFTPIQKTDILVNTAEKILKIVP